MIDFLTAVVEVAGGTSGECCLHNFWLPNQVAIRNNFPMINLGSRGQICVLPNWPLPLIAESEAAGVRKTT